MISQSIARKQGRMSRHYNKIENVLTPLANSLLKVLLRIAQVDLRWRRLGEEGLVKHVRSKFRSLLKPTVQMMAFIRCGFLSPPYWFEPRKFYLLTNWLAYLYGRIQSPRPDVMPDRREGITRATGFVFACIDTQAS